jgi:predicted RNA-binding protein Jag
MSRFLQPDKPTENIAYHLSAFFKQKHNFDYQKSNAEVEKIGIVNLKFVPGKNGEKGSLTIYTTRPGLLIGPKGSNIDALKIYLAQYNVGKILIEEAFCWTSMLMHYDLGVFLDDGDYD